MNEQGYGTVTTQNKYINSTREFFKSKTLLAQISFAVLIIVVFILLLRLGITFLSWIFAPTGTVTIIKGKVDGNKQLIIYQNPSSSGDKLILRSNNQNDGIEFTWSVWLNIQEQQNSSNTTTYNFIFSKGDNSLLGQYNGAYTESNAPALYYDGIKNRLIIYMNTFQTINEEINITNIPLNKWINVIIRCKGNQLDVYINGSIVVSHTLSGVPKQNYGDVYVGSYGGFDGELSQLQYFSHALSISEIQKIISTGPNMTNYSASTGSEKESNFLSLRWYSEEITNS